jgi:hypothetical protein
MSPFFVLLLVTMLAAVINIGRLLRSRGDLQHAADAAALAAADSLERKTSPGPAPGRSFSDFDGSPGSLQDVADQYAHAHSVMDEVGQHPSVDMVNDVQFGFWHFRGPERCAFSAGNCTDRWEPAPSLLTGMDLFAVNAVRVTTRYSVAPVLGKVAGLGTIALNATASAVGRRGKVKCSLPLAINACDLTDANGFSCTGGVKSMQFRSSRNTAGPTTGVLGYIDVLNINDPTSMPPLETFVRRRSADIDYRCSQENLDHLVGIAPQVPPGYVADARPIVDGLLGIPEKGQNQENWPLACELGRRLVVPVVKPANCAIWPPRNVSGEEAMVIGYVTIRFTSVQCDDGVSVLTQSNCETATTPSGGRVATTCQGGYAPAAVTAGENLLINADVFCEQPLGPYADVEHPQQPFPPRLIR